MRLIDADALIRDIEGYHVSDGWFQHWVEVQPTIEPKRKKGHWIPQDHNIKYGMITTTAYFYPKCSRCGNCDNYTNFCSECGADMRGEQDD